MKKNYFFRGLTCASALVIASSAMAEGAWRDCSNLMVNPAYIQGWNGALTATGEGVGETWNGAFEIYQTVRDLPAGEYTLTCNAHYRCGSNDRSIELMKEGKNHNAFIFINGTESPVEGLFDSGKAILPADTEFDPAVYAPNSLAQANTCYSQGLYLNTVKAIHAGGDLVIGIRNYGGDFDEWCAFDNFKLVGPNGEVALVNGDFSSPLNDNKNQTEWNCMNVNGDNKSPDVNRWGGVYRKCNGSPYNISQSVELPAGKYRFSVQSFMRHGNGNESGWYVPVKGSWSKVEGESAYDLHLAGKENDADKAYMFISNGWVNENGAKGKPFNESEAKEGNPNAVFNVVAIKCIFDEKHDVYPDNEPKDGDNWENGATGWTDSGHEREVSAFFVKNPTAYRNYAEIVLTEPSTVWYGIYKDNNKPAQYWHAWRDMKLEKWIEDSSIENVASDNAAPVYYNLQGIEVVNPANGVFIVRKGNTVSKQVIK